MSQTRRSNVSIYNYPEHLNPFNEETSSPQPQNHQESKSKDTKHKFWTFGRSRKKRSNSFSIKSTWNGLFGKRKETPDARDKRSTITTVSSTYKNEPCIRPVAPPRISRDQQEFDEALGTLARRRKYTLDNSSRYSSSLTVNGDPARIYEGSPQDTTTSIMGDLTPRPPARRRRFGNRSSQRLNTSTLETEEDEPLACDLTLHDENENVPEDYIFKRFTQDAVRRSNLSINSCTSITSTVSSYGRKKRKAPQPPCRREKLETAQEDEVQKTAEAPEIQLQITEPIDIARVTENINELTKKSQELVERTNEKEEAYPESSSEADQAVNLNDVKDTSSKEVVEDSVKDNEVKNSTVEDSEEKSETKDTTEESVTNSLSPSHKDHVEITSNELEPEVNEVVVEYRKTSQDSLEIIKDVDIVNSSSELEDVCLRRKSSSNSLSRSDSFSVKEEIEKIEKQIKALELNSLSRESSEESTDDIKVNGRQSIQANRRHFFQDMVDTETDKGVKIEFKELPREQNDIHVVRLTDPPVPIAAPRDPVKVIELHISEPIKQKPEILDDVNPIPKPRRHSALNLNGSHDRVNFEEDQKVSEPHDKRGKSF